MKLHLAARNLTYVLLFTASLLTCTIGHTHGGGGGHWGGGGHGGHWGGHGGHWGHGGYWGGGYWGGGYWGGPWYGPGVVINVPPGGYYYPEPVCSIVQRCYPNGMCTDYQVCE